MSTGSIRYDEFREKKFYKTDVQLIIAALPIRAHEGSPLGIHKAFTDGTLHPRSTNYSPVHRKKPTCAGNYNNTPMVMGQERHNGFNLNGML